MTGPTGPDWDSLALLVVASLGVVAVAYVLFMGGAS